jgi:hypothetical protein
MPQSQILSSEPSRENIMIKNTPQFLGLESSTDDQLNAILISHLSFSFKKQIIFSHFLPFFEVFVK